MYIPLDQFYPFGDATVSRGDDNSSSPHSELYVSYKPFPKYVL